MTDEPMMTICECCGGEVLDTEVQMCELCGADGLCEQCIGECDHPCEPDEEDTD